ncbi:MAG: DUF2264 domain-containing protein [Chitinophagaceae bacterium]
MKRRNFVQNLSALAIAAPVIGLDARAQTRNSNKQTTAKPVLNDREYWIKTLTKIADPLLLNLSKQTLKQNMPVEAQPGKKDDRSKFTYLEAFGRLLAGMAPWLELGPDDTPEGKLRKTYIDLTISCIENAVNPSSKDYMNFGKPSITPSQSLVDAAFFAHGLIRAPKQIYGKLSASTKEQVLTALRLSRGVPPGYNNWLLFMAMVEAMFLRFDEQYDIVRLDYATKKHNEWYKGDGIYGDGDTFHWDYYNSYVIHPMMLQVIQTMQSKGIIRKEAYDTTLRRAQRYAFIQERLIAPDGTFPVIGRSICYRIGAFQALSQIALMKSLPTGVSPMQVRSALTAVMKKIFESPNNFDSNGWLQIGLAGHQLSLGEDYISTGSLYLTSTGFLALGLPPEDEFWSGAAADWSSKKIWAGQDTHADHALWG